MRLKGFEPLSSTWKAEMINQTTLQTLMGLVGFEPTTSVLETDMLPGYTIDPVEEETQVSSS